VPQFDPFRENSLALDVTTPLVLLVRGRRKRLQKGVTIGEHVLAGSLVRTGKELRGDI
jgi:hypothetical protein